MHRSVGMGLHDDRDSAHAHILPCTFTASNRNAILTDDNTVYNRLKTNMPNTPNPSAPLVMRLSEKDNIVVAVRSLPASEKIVTDYATFVLQSKIDVGHKIALQDIAKGEKIIKWGMPIGSATVDIRAGEHVHLHNLKSDYLPTFTHDSPSPATPGEGRGEGKHHE